MIADVFADQWLLVHRDLRALPRVRAVMDAVIVLFQRERGPCWRAAKFSANRYGETHLSVFGRALVVLALVGVAGTAKVETASASGQT